jgi:hypothetical protein
MRNKRTEGRKEMLGREEKMISLIYYSLKSLWM